MIPRIQQMNPGRWQPFTPYCSAATTLLRPTAPRQRAAFERAALARLRHSQLFRDDPRSRHGSLWMTENGPANYDEVNRVTPG